MRASGIDAPLAWVHCSSTSSASRFHTPSRAVSPINTRCSTNQDTLPRPNAQTETSTRSFCTSAPAESSRPPAGTVPIG